MASFFRRPASKVKLALIPVGGVALGYLARRGIESDFIQKNETIKDITLTARGTLRAAKLLTIVSIICLDYGYVIFKKRDEETEFDKLSNEIVRIRDEHDKATRLRWKSVGTDEEEALKMKVAELYEQMNELSERCSKVESNYADCHRRTARRLLELCESNGGVYVKLGQHISQLDYLFPKEIISALRQLLKNNTQSSYESVRSVIKEDLGYFPEELWADFETTPIASASLAQVHVAHDKDGRKFAVKVQHQPLQVTAESDIAAVSGHILF